ncbi:thioredoxin family protein [Botrimarina sp.]|uniref:thioredoxin family protein n=1 Tax=Botrimarina sp. TaxID=2795802 RepID=UPI0032EC5DF5
MCRLLALTVAALAVAAPSAVGQFPFFGRPTAGAEIRWVETPADALAAAKRSGKPILAYVTSAHCGYCRKMERETWASPAVARLVDERFVALRLHSDQHPEEVAALRVRAFPTTVVITPEGKAFAGRAGFVEAAQLAEQLLRPALEHEAVASRPATSVN